MRKIGLFCSKNVITIAICLVITTMFLSCRGEEEPSDGRIYGVVVDSKTSEPIRGATVRLDTTGENSTIIPHAYYS